jgi:hypothetical protein
VLPDGLEERFRELRRRPTVRKALREDREGAVRSLAFATDRAYWLVSEPLDPPRNSPGPEPVETPGPDDAVAGLDGDGRPILVRRAFGLYGEAPAAVVAHPAEAEGPYLISVRLLAWGDGHVEEVGFLNADSVSHVTWIDLDDEGRPIRFARRGGPRNTLGRGARVAWCDWQGDVCTRVGAVEQPDEASTVWLPRLRVAMYDDDGLARVVTGMGPRASDAAEARAALDTVPVDHVAWDRELDGYEASPLEGGKALDVWADALLDAAAGVAGEASGPFFTVCLGADFGPDPPWLQLHTAATRDVARRRAAHPVDVLRADSTSVDLLPRLSPDALRALRSLRQLKEATRRDYDAPQPWPDAALAERLVRGLDELAWDRAEPFLPSVTGNLVPYPPDPDESPVFAFERSVFGGERVAEFLASLQRPVSVAAPPPVKRAPRSRAELAEHLRARELDLDLADEADWGLALLPGGKGRSRLGGGPLLPEGTEWPAYDGLGLTHLASIDLTELPNVEGRENLPADGILVLMADLTEHASLWEPATVGGDPRMMLLHVPAETPTYEPEVPPGSREPDETPVKMRLRRIRFEPVLTLRQRDAAGYDDLYDDLAGVTPGLRDPAHLMLGHPAVVQEDPRAPGDVNVLHIGWDEALGFEFLDAGDLTLHGCAADVRAGRWERLTLTPNSC